MLEPSYNLAFLVLFYLQMPVLRVEHVPSFWRLHCGCSVRVERCPFSVSLLRVGDLSSVQAICQWVSVTPTTAFFLHYHQTRPGKKTEWLPLSSQFRDSLLFLYASSLKAFKTYFSKVLTTIWLQAYFLWWAYNWAHRCPRL